MPMGFQRLNPAPTDCRRAVARLCIGSSPRARADTSSSGVLSLFELGYQATGTPSIGSQGLGGKPAVGRLVPGDTDNLGDLCAPVDRHRAVGELITTACRLRGFQPPKKQPTRRALRERRDPPSPPQALGARSISYLFWQAERQRS